MNFINDLLESVGLRKRETRVGLRPHRDIVLPLGIDAAHERVLEGFHLVLGANVYVDDRTTHTIEAGFGTINQERIRATLESEDAARTRVRIEAHHPAGVEHPNRSLAVDTLGDALSKGTE